MHEEKKFERLRLACQNTGMRLTHQRMEIFREVTQSNEHPDAETIASADSRRLPQL